MNKKERFVVGIVGNFRREKVDKDFMKEQLYNNENISFLQIYYFFQTCEQSLILLCHIYIHFRTQYVCIDCFVYSLQLGVILQILL